MPNPMLQNRKSAVSEQKIGCSVNNFGHMPHSAHWFQSYGKVFFHVSWFVQWPYHWIGHEKLPQNDPSYATFCPLVPKLWKGLLPCQLICTVTSPLDWAWKTTPKWPLICLNPSIGWKVMERSSPMSADLYRDITVFFYVTWLVVQCLYNITWWPIGQD